MFVRHCGLVAVLNRKQAEPKSDYSTFKYIKTHKLYLSEVLLYNRTVKVRVCFIVNSWVFTRHTVDENYCILKLLGVKHQMIIKQACLNTMTFQKQWKTVIKNTPNQPVTVQKRSERTRRVEALCVSDARVYLSKQEARRTEFEFQEATNCMETHQQDYNMLRSAFRFPD